MRDVEKKAARNGERGAVRVRPMAVVWAGRGEEVVKAGMVVGW